MNDPQPIIPRGSIFRWIIIAIAIAAAVGILLVALHVFGIAIPLWVQQIFWIIVVAVVAIAAVKFIWSLVQ